MAIAIFARQWWRCLSGWEDCMTLVIKAKLRRFLGCRAFWTAIVCTLSYVVLEWMLQLVSFGFLSGWMAALANILMVWAPGVLRRAGQDAEVPPARLRAVGLAAALGLFGALVVLASQPNAAWLVERIRPWLP
jgi:hypothetical protein